MNLNNVEFYNLGAFENIPGFGDNVLVRVPAVELNYKDVMGSNHLFETQGDNVCMVYQ